MSTNVRRLSAVTAGTLVGLLLWSASTMAATPAKPKQPRLSAKAVSYTEISLSWNRDSAVDSYEVYMGTPKRSRRLATLTGSSTRWVVGGLQPGARYSFYVVAANRRGSTDSDVAAATTPAVTINRANLDGLTPDFRAKVEQVLMELTMLGWKPKVQEGLRTKAQQEEKVRKGYSSVSDSKHLYGLAADIIDSRWGWSGPAADKGFQFWKDLGAAAKRNGLTWGGDWKIQDVAHVEQ